jgi:hypothetical protein
MPTHETEDLFTVVALLDQMLRDEAEKKAEKGKPTKTKKGRGIGS